MDLPNDPPPPYPGPPSSHLPPYSEAVAVDDSADSHRLPSYQPRTSRRYHPYWQMRLDPATDIITRYQNTIFDESYTPLIQDAPIVIPAAAAMPTALIPPAPTIPAPLPPVNPPPPPLVPDNELSPQERHRRRVRRLFHLIPEFERAVREGLEAAKREMARRARHTS
ncbi:hypothetical protein DXG01_004261 [Tephrocybe rancida]|nr:hypothetical protein DXG01_004261 [Tephrocybe rancida]